MCSVQDRAVIVGNDRRACMRPAAGSLRSVLDSERAAEWAASLGIAMNHVEIGTNGHHLTLVFHDLVVEDLPIGFAPYTTGTDGPNAKMPWGPHTGHG